MSEQNIQMTKIQKVNQSLFDNLVKFLRKNGYKVKIVSRFDPDYRFAQVSGKWIRGGFCEFNEHVYKDVNFRFAFDNTKCFDKWSKCPFSLPLPITQLEYKYILKNLRFLATKKGYKLSNNYDLPWIKEYPRGVENHDNPRI